MRRIVTRAATVLTTVALASGPLAAHARPPGARDRPTVALARYYGIEPKVSLSALEARAARAIRDRLGRAGVPRVSGALVVACRELAERAAAGDPDPISRDRVRAALARAAAFDAAPAAVLVSSGPSELARALARALPRAEAAFVGAGVAEREGTAYAVVLLSDRKLALEPFPREVAPGSRAVLRGALARGLSDPRVFVTLPSGDVVEATVSGSPGFRASVDVATPGRYAVEVVAEGRRGPEVAGLLIVSSGGAALERAARTPAAPDPPDRAAAEARIVAALNRTRRRHGLAAAAPSQEIAAVARKHAEAMAAAGMVAHVVPGSGEVGARLARAGVAYRRAYENVARAATGLEAHDAVEESPAHLGNVLRPGASRVGVGIARARLPSGDPIVYLAEVLVEPPERDEDSHLTPDARVREALWRERARLALPPLTSDPALDALARDAAAGMRTRDDTEADGLGRGALALPRKLAAVDVFVASGVEEAARSTNLRDARFGRVGVGVAEGDSRRFGRGRLWIAVVYTD